MAKFTSKFSLTLSSRSVFQMGDTEIHVARKYSAPWRTILHTNCSWEQVANGANNCCLLLTNHKLPHCSPCNIIQLRGPQVYYTPSFQTLAVRHANSSAKFICASQQAAHWPPWSAELWIWSASWKSSLCNHNSKLDIYREISWRANSPELIVILLSAC
jgi:hypothetical protein